MKKWPQIKALPMVLITEYAGDGRWKVIKDEQVMYCSIEGEDAENPHVLARAISADWKVDVTVATEQPHVIWKYREPT